MADKASPGLVYPWTNVTFVRWSSTIHMGLQYNLNDTIYCMGEILFHYENVNYSLLADTINVL